MRFLILSAATLAGLYAVVVLLATLVQRQLIYPGATFAALREPVEQPAGVEAVTIRTRDGERLHALYAAPRQGGGLILTFHGNGSRPEWHAERFVAEPWRSGGWGVLAIAYRGYAGSTGSPSEDGLIEDALSAYRFARERAPDAPVLLHGHSLGAALAVAVAEREPNLGLYLEAPFDSMTRTAQWHYPYLPIGLLLRDTYRSDLRIAAGNTPVLIVQGDDDDVVPAERARALAAAAGSRARLEIIPADHDTVFGSRDALAETMFRALLPSRADATAR